MTDTIADLLTRIRNAYMAGKSDVSIPHSRIKQLLAEKISALGYVGKVSTQGEGIEKSINLELLYRNKTPLLTGIVRSSKPGRRVYIKSHQIPRTLSGYGSSILFTSKGILSDVEAKNQKTGGELVCQIW